MALQRESFAGTPRASYSRPTLAVAVAVAEKTKSLGLQRLCGDVESRMPSRQLVHGGEGGHVGVCLVGVRWRIARTHFRAVGLRCA